jgi:hypothetical protein
MNALAKAPLHGEIIPPAASVSVYGTTHPLNVVANAQIRCRVQAGLSITEILMEALASKPGHVLRRDFIVKIGDHEIPEANWSKVRVKEGATVTFIPRLQGGGALRSILGLVVSIAALAFAGPIAGALGLTIAGFALTGTALSVTTALVAGGIILAGTLALNALFPTRPAATPDSVTATSLNSIQGAQNQANPFGPIPVVLGTHRQSPYYAAKPYTEIIGDDQYIRLLFCPGYGPMEMSDFKIGETPLSSFSYDWIEVNQGFVGDTPPTIYPGSVDEVALSVTLSNTVDPPGVNGGNGTWQSQTTAAETDEISLDFTATEGSYAVNTQTGNLDGYNIYVAIRYRLVGAGSWSDGGAVQINRSVNPARVGTLINVARGQYEVQARKLLGDANSEKVKDKVVWTALRSIKQRRKTRPISSVMCCKVQPTRPVADALMDLTSLQDWWAYCATNGFKFNQVRNTVLRSPMHSTTSARPGARWSRPSSTASGGLSGTARRLDRPALHAAQFVGLSGAEALHAAAARLAGQLHQRGQRLHAGRADRL